ncbi:MAG: acetylglutamate kinase [Bradymonadia bacterium]
MTATRRIPVADSQAKAAVLVEALPYIQRFQGQTFVVKYGGHAMVDDAARVSFARDVVLMRSIGINIIVVHGGGPMIKRALCKFGITSRFKDGMRITDDATMDVVRMVLLGQVNPDVVGLINQAGGRAVGLSGADGNLLRARVMDPELGRVGVPTRIDDGEMRLLTRGGFIPVIAPVGVDADGRPLNINADLAASAIAQHVLAAKFMLMTDTDGVRDASGAPIGSLESADALRLIDAGVIAGGMIPKVRCALEALNAGVPKVHIVDGRQAHALLLEIFTDRGVGTELI